MNKSEKIKVLQSENKMLKRQLEAMTLYNSSLIIENNRFNKALTAIYEYSFADADEPLLTMPDYEMAYFDTKDMARKALDRWHVK